MKTFETAARPTLASHEPCPLCGSLRMRRLWDFGTHAFAACLGCGLVQQDPRPLESDALSRYNHAYFDYENDRQFDYARLERLGLADLGLSDLAALGASLAPRGGRPRVLDVGCATGALLSDFAAAGWDCLGVEVCAPAAEYGRRRFGLDIRISTLSAAGLETGSVELFHASHLIEHLFDPRAFLLEARRLLAPGGRLVITTPNIAGFQARLLGRGWRSVIFDHLFLFSVSSLSRLLAATGFRILRRATWGGWAAGLRPRLIKPGLDSLAKLLGFGDVMSFLCEAREPAGGEAGDA
jgi:SAM-dependent methyltransferase